MKLGDIYNMEHYLANDCYCKGEIYDTSGFFFIVFNKDDECEQLGKRDCEEGISEICVICRNQLLNFYAKDGKIIGAELFDATENNIKILKMFLQNQRLDGMRIDEFEKGYTEKSLNEIMSIADAISI